MKCRHCGIVVTELSTGTWLHLADLEETSRTYAYCRLTTATPSTLVNDRRCHRCGRWGSKQFVWNGDMQMWECSNQDACGARGGFDAILRS